MWYRKSVKNLIFASFDYRKSVKKTEFPTSNNVYPHDKHTVNRAQLFMKFARRKKDASLSYTN